jgi:uncharacterized protein YgbK (DUF1537 family)
MMNEEPQPATVDALLGSLPPEWPQDVLLDIRKALTRKVIVLDDDPTGTQTVHSIPVYTTWTVEALSRALREIPPCVYVLTNSRSLPEAGAVALAREIGANLRAAGQATGVDFAVVSRSDSTLRGHYPAETDGLAEAAGLQVDATLIIPFFLEGGRYTIGDAHWVRSGEVMTPAAQTEFARDPAFGYRHSNLRAWVEEKMGGRLEAGEVASLSLDEVRQGGAERVHAWLRGLSGGRVAVVNAASYRDMEVFVLGLLRAEADGKRFLYRTAASFVRARAGLRGRALLSAREMGAATEGKGAGLVVAGSFVERTTRQLERLLAWRGTIGICLKVGVLLSVERTREIRRALSRVEDALRGGMTAVVFTSRQRLAASGEDALSAGQRISAALVEIVQRIETRPAFVIGKGGITSSDVATRGLGVRRAMVLGQIAPGVPVWRLGEEAKWPGVPLVVFPGNVGDDATLLECVRCLEGER